LLKVVWWDLHLASLLTHLFVTSPMRVVAKYYDECIYLSVCLSVCPTGYLRNPMRSLPNLCACYLPIAVARSSSGTLMIGRITYRREGGDGSAQCGQSVICHCLVFCFVRFSFCAKRLAKKNVSEMTNFVSSRM